MKLTDEMLARARLLRQEPIVLMAVEYLKAQANKDLLLAKTPEEREEKWRDYHAFARVDDLIAKWAAKSETKD